MEYMYTHRGVRSNLRYTSVTAGRGKCRRVDRRRSAFVGQEDMARRGEGEVARRRSGRGAGGGGGMPQRRERHPAHAATRLAAVAGPASAGPSCPRLLHRRPARGGEDTPLDRRCSSNGGHYGAFAVAALERRRKKEEDGERERSS